MSHERRTDTLPIEQELSAEERNYSEALRADKTFEVLKAIKQRIKMLKAELFEKTGMFNGGRADM